MQYKKLFSCTLLMVSCLALITLANSCNNAIETHKHSEPDVKFPGSDTANFPTSPFTLPKGRGYLENFFLGIDFEGNNTPFQYNWPFLLRLGITDSFELRLAGLGITYIAAHQSKARISGFSPLIFDCKMHFSGTRDDLWWPSTGIEMYILTPIASQDLKIGTQFVAIALFNHEFPHKIALEWNAGIGFSHYKKFQNSDDVFGTVSWALQKAITPEFELFFQGLYNTKICHVFPKLFFLGVGFQRIITKQFLLYGNVNWSLLHTTNPYLLNIGFMVAF